jgi:hypothetical protein
MELWRFLAADYDRVLAIANVVIALGTIVLAFGIPYTIREASRQERDTFYATLDRTYFDIQKLQIDYPHLGLSDRDTKTPEQITQYNAFAFIVWNFIETIYDYSKEEKPLATTWKCILQYEAQKHAAWFLNPENHPKFKPEFIDYVQKSGLVRKPAAKG